MPSQGESSTRRFARRTLLKGAGITAVGATTATNLKASGAPPGAATAQRAPVIRIGPRPGPPGSILIELTVNETTYEMPTDSRWTLAEVLRDQVGLMGTKVGCDRGECGSCTVLLNDEPVLSCMTLAAQVAGSRVLTVEGLSQGARLHPLQQAFLDHHGLACGFCTPGMLLSAKALLDRNARPTQDDIRAALAGNLCRCTGYQKIVESVDAAARLR